MQPPQRQLKGTLTRFLASVAMQLIMNFWGYFMVPLQKQNYGAASIRQMLQFKLLCTALLATQSDSAFA
jgi:hypothetical protein